MEIGLKGLNALVTGGSKGLGFATAKMLLRDGANVVINSRSQTNLIAAGEKLSKFEHSGKLLTETGDVTNESDCQNIILNTVNKLGGLDILITNSGGPPPGLFEDLSQEQWDAAIDLSFKSHLMLIRKSIPFLKKSKHPSVLAITSVSVKNPLDNLILSNTVRAATVALTKSLSFELGREGIRFNAILPGWTLTDRVENLLSVRANKNNSTIAKEMDKIAQSIPLGRMADPDEFAKPAAFLVSPAASYINGVALTVDGGITRSLL